MDVRTGIIINVCSSYTDGASHILGCETRYEVHPILDTNKKLSYRRGTARRTLPVEVFANCCTKCLTTCIRIKAVQQ